MKPSTALIKTATITLALGVHCATRAADDCDPNIMISNADMKKNDWRPFHGVVAAVDTRAGAFRVKTGDKQYAVYVTTDTIICNHGKPGKLRDAKIGDTIGGIGKLTNGRSVAVRVGIGGASELLPYGIIVPGKEGYVLSPYAQSKPPVDVRKVPYDGVVRCPYTGKLFINPAPRR